MNQPLRRVHCAIWLVLPAMLFALLIAGLMARRTTTPPNAAVHWEQGR